MNSPKVITPLSDDEVLKRVLTHVDAGTTDLGDEVWREPVENYRSQQRFDAELALFRSIPTIYCPASSLPERGSYLARTHAGAPLLAVRGDDGVVRVFHNACRHRGMMLAEGEGQLRGGMVCRYHAWSYRLNGELRSIAGGPEGFPGVDPAEHGLRQLHVQQRGGFIFVSHEEPIAQGALEALPIELTTDQIVFDHTVFTDDANWKLLKEFSMEGYHIKSLHHESFYPYGYDNLNVIETFGPNSRITFPFRRIEKVRDKALDDRGLAGRVTYLTQLFPNARVSILSNHYQIVVLEPISPSQTRWHVFRTTLPGQSQDEASLEAAKRDAEFVKDTGLLEDRAAALSSQASLAGNGNTHFTFGRFEKAVVHFHRHLDLNLARLAA